jgi:DNA-binding beta-propeller fold protein YncE
MIALVMALGELLFNSRVVGSLGATLFFFHGSLRHLTSFLPSGYQHRAETWGFWKQIAFVNERHMPFAVGIFLLVLIFLVDWYRRRSSAKSFLFSGLLVAAVPLWNAPAFVAAAVVLFCLIVAYGLWWLSTLKTPPMLGRVLAGALTAGILAAGLFDLLAVYNSSRVEVNYEREPLVKGLDFRNSVIYKLSGSSPADVAGKDVAKTPVTAFQGGRGSGKGQFDDPRGIAIDGAGNIFVADTSNARIQKFSPNGTFVTSMGTKGRGPGQLEAPTGIAIARTGKLYVADAGNHRVQKLAPDGTLIAEWKGAEPGFYGPRRIAIGPDDSIYVVDQGHARIVRFNLDGEVLATWGSGGTGDGQFRDPTSVAVDPTNKVYVADPLNSRIQVFDSNGKFLNKWSIPEWAEPSGFEDLAVNPDTGRLYASSAHMSTILVFDLQGNRTGTLMPGPPDKLNSPSALALTKDKLLVLNSASARVSVIDLQNR